MSLQQTAQKHGVQTCVDCNRCLEVCPIHHADRRFNPASLAKAFIEDRADLDEQALFTLWTCLSCRACLSRCPEPPPDFAGFAPAAREQAHAHGVKPQFPHGGALQRIMALTLTDGAVQNRLDWVPPDLKKDVQKGGVLYFTGCMPFLDAALGREFNSSATMTARSGLVLLDRAGLNAGFMEKEICCGHDFLISGDNDGFHRHARTLSRMINDSGASTVVCPCQECVQCLGEFYPTHGFPLQPAVAGLAEILAGHIDKLNPHPARRTVATHVESGRGDAAKRTGWLKAACKAVPETRVHTMETENGSPHTVGVAGFLSCGGWSAQLQNRLLQAAHKQGADLLVTDCLKAAVHLNCALRPGTWQRAPVQVAHIADFIAAQISTSATDGGGS
jgi:Fe-S oxidoreductase